MTDALMKYETIDRRQIDDIMAGKIPREPKGWSDLDSSDPEGGSSVSSEEKSDAESEQTKDSSDDSSDSSDGSIGGTAGQH